MRLLVLILAALATWAPLSAPAQAQARATERIEAELVSLSDRAVPGSTLMLAVRQKIAPGWHTYWRNPGDSGGATTLTWRLPGGFQAGEIVWPLPERQRLGPLMNYGYQGEVFLPVPVQVPTDASPGSRATFEVTALFLVCSAEMCVPEPLDLSLALPVALDAPKDGPHAAAIRRALEAAPRPAPIEARLTRGEGGVLLSATGAALEGATRAYFFPFEPGRVQHAAAQDGERGARGVTLNLTPGAKYAAPLSGVLATDVGAFEIAAQAGDPLADAGGRGPLSADAPIPPQGSAGVWAALGLALLGGLVLNLMPCVFPVLAMKAAGLASAAHEPARARRDGVAFLAGVLVAFLVLGGLLLALRAAGQSVGWGFQLQSPTVVAALALLSLAVGLNLSGVYHLGAGLQSAAGAGPLARLGGTTGAFLTGVLAVAVAAPCTAPFMAAALGAALVLPWPAALGVFLALGLGLALPYVAVSFSPALLRRLPRPGPWMETLKGLLAFPMYGTALWLTWVVSAQTSAEALALVLGAGLLTGLGLWLYGRSQTTPGRESGAWLLAAGMALALAVVVVQTMARLPPPEATATEARGPLKSQPWSVDAVAAARAEGRPVLVNFTADWCVTCKLNETTALSSARLAEALERRNALYLVADWTRRDDVITAELTRQGRSGVPLYLLYPTNGGEPRILPQLLTEGAILKALDEAG